MDNPKHLSLFKYQPFLLHLTFDILTPSKVTPYGQAQKARFIHHFNCMAIKNKILKENPVRTRSLWPPRRTWRGQCQSSCWRSTSWRECPNPRGHSHSAWFSWSLPLLLCNERFVVYKWCKDDVPSVYFSVVEPVYSIGYDLVCIYMVLYLQSAVVMMDCLTVLSITSHTHKHNKNEVSIIIGLRNRNCLKYWEFILVTFFIEPWNCLINNYIAGK